MGKMSYKIDVHDYDVRVKAATRFINQGNRVKLTVMFKGREVQHDKLGYELLNKVATDMEKLCVMDTKPKRAGMSISCFVSPKPEVLRAINEKKRADEKAKSKKKQREKSSPVKKEAVVAQQVAAEVVQQQIENNDKVEIDIVSILEDEDDDDDDDDAA